MTNERKAVYYGRVELIPGIICDGYVLDDSTAVMSERGTANLLGMDQKTLGAVRGNWPPKTLKPFIDKDFTVRGNLIEVVAKNSPHCGRKIVVYSTETIQLLIHTYGIAYINGGLRENQIHIGKRAVILSISLVRTALEAAIREACGLPIHIQQTAQQHYLDAVGLILKAGFICSIEGNIAIKKDILNFLGITKGKLNSYLRKHRDHIKPIPLTRQQIRSTGSHSYRMNGYSLEDVAKIALSMDSVPGIQLKEQLFGHIGVFAKPYTRKEIHWQAHLSETFEGLGFHHNYQLGPYRADFFIGSSRVVLECNGYEHRYYDAEREQKREEFITREYGLIRFHHQTKLEKVINAILRVKPGEIIRLD